MEPSEACYSLREIQKTGAIMAGEDKKVVVVGASGRMGRMLVAEIAGTEGVSLHGATEPPGSPALGQDPHLLAGVDPSDVIITDDPAPAIASADLVIDFTVPAATIAHAKLCAQAGTAMVIGTTGLTKEDEAALEIATRHVPIVYAANYSVGVTLLTNLVEKAAATLREDYDIEVLEMHHHHKVDAPSGTALALGKAAAKGRDVDHDSMKRAVRDGITGAREKGTIGYATLRGGDVVGEHDVVFAAPGERIILSHKATARRIFAAGAVRAGAWVIGRQPAIYDMNDVLGLKDDVAPTVPPAEQHG